MPRVFRLYFYSGTSDGFQLLGGNSHTFGFSPKRVVFPRAFARRAEHRDDVSRSTASFL